MKSVDSYDPPRIKIFNIYMSKSILVMSGDNETYDVGDDIGEDED